MRNSLITAHSALSWRKHASEPIGVDRQIYAVRQSHGERAGKIDAKSLGIELEVDRWMDGEIMVISSISLWSNGDDRHIMKPLPQFHPTIFHTLLFLSSGFFGCSTLLIYPFRLKMYFLCFFLLLLQKQGFATVRTLTSGTSRSTLLWGN